MKHVKCVTMTPLVSTSTIGVKTDMILSIIDRLLLVQRQSPWKTVFIPGTDDSDDDTDT